MDVVVDTSALPAVVVGEPATSKTSPLDVPSIKAKISTKELVEIVREGRDRVRGIGCD